MIHILIVDSFKREEESIAILSGQLFNHYKINLISECAEFISLKAKPI